MTSRPREIVLDTRALSALLDERKPDHTEAQRALELRLRARATREGAADQPLFIVPSLVLYEVRRGLLKRDNQRLLRKLAQLLRAVATIEPFDEAMADRAAVEWVTRTRAGRTPGELDLLIASTAAVLGADVVTADNGFPEPEGVRLLRWADLAAG